MVRFNGGAQAGHTVVTPDGRRHVFSHFGSGTLAGAATYLSRHFVCHPTLFFKEAAALAAIGASAPRVVVDARAIVSTPYDILINQIVERQRGEGRHGSCGVGFGETIARNLVPEFALTVADLGRGAGYLLHRLSAIRRDYVPGRLHALGVGELDAQAAAWLASDSAMQRFAQDSMRFLRATSSAPPALLADYTHIVFEGAQGLLLDQDRGAFPWVTRSHTGIRNALDVATDAGIGALDVTYVSRAYLTRHGAGPLADELPHPPYAGIVDSTNVPNAFQGTLRFAHLDLDRLARSIRTDFADASAYPGVAAKLNVAVTCLDQVGSAVSCVEHGTLTRIAPEMLAGRLAARVDASKVYAAWGPTRATVRSYAVTPRQT